MTDLEVRMLKDKDQMYAANKELQQEVDYYKGMYEDIKALVGKDLDGYEVVLAVRDLL